MTSLWWFLQRWWGPLEADFQRFYRIDLSDIWTDDLSPRRFRVLSSRLPADSALVAAYRKVQQETKPAPKSATQDVRAFFGGGAKFTGGG